MNAIGLATISVSEVSVLGWGGFKRRVNQTVFRFQQIFINVSKQLYVKSVPDRISLGLVAFFVALLILLQLAGKFYFYCLLSRV